MSWASDRDERLCLGLEQQVVALEDEGEESQMRQLKQGVLLHHPSCVPHSQRF